MTNGIYGYYDIKNKYVVYIGQDKRINENKRHKAHLDSSKYNKQKINQTLQSNPDRYVYFKFIEGNYTQDEIDNFEKEAIKLFKTYKYDYPERSVFNFTPGGDIIPSRIPEIAKKISENHVDASGKNNPNYGKKHSEANRLKMSEIKNSCGYYRVYKNKDKNCKQGYIYTYQYYDEDNKRRSISSIDIKKLENKVKKKGLKWIKFK